MRLGRGESCDVCVVVVSWYTFPYKTRMHILFDNLF
jgi:hypothetical protein